MTFRLTPQASAALRSGLHPLAPLVEVVLPGHTMRHLVGAGEVPWGDNVFTGSDPMFGSLVAAGSLKDGIGDEAPDWDLTFVPPSNVAAAALASASAQGGRIIPDPLQLFSGELDVPRLRVGKGTRTVEWRCTSALEPFHDQEIGARLSDAWHRLVWPGEEGLANMTGIERTSYWGVEKPPSAVSVITGSTKASFL
jgi:hypothetical protein